MTHTLAGEVGVVEVIGSGEFEHHIPVRWNLTGELYYRKDFITSGVPRATEIQQTHQRKGHPPLIVGTPITSATLSARTVHVLAKSSDQNVQKTQLEVCAAGKGRRYPVAYALRS